VRSLLNGLAETILEDERDQEGERPTRGDFTEVVMPEGWNEQGHSAMDSKIPTNGMLHAMPSCAPSNSAADTLHGQAARAQPTLISFLCRVLLLMTVTTRLFAEEFAQQRHGGNEEGQPDQKRINRI